MIETQPKRERSSPVYPRREQVLRAIETVRSSGLRVSSVQLGRDGTIRLSDESTAPAETLFDVWDRENKL
jgi:hypothetical protein